MQISGGRFKGLRIRVGKRVRPTSSFNRKRIFDILGSVEGFDVLDLFSGSGALGLEALSRGASRCVFVEISPQNVRIIEDNLKRAGVSSVARVVRADVLGFLKTYTGEFDLILADPPYTWDRKRELLRGVVPLLRRGGVFVLEFPSRERPVEVPSLRMFKLVKGGDTALVFYRRTHEGDRDTGASFLK